MTGRSIHTKTPTADPMAIILALAAAEALDGKKALEIALLDVGDLLQITEVFVLATGTSRRHVITLGEEVADKLRAHGRKPLRVEGGEEGEWVLLDFGDVIVHVFQEHTRAFYDLERLWGDAPRVPWRPPVRQE